MAAQSKAWLYGRSLAGIGGSNPGGKNFQRFVLSDTDLCEGPITLPEESYRVWCVSECYLETSAMKMSEMNLKKTQN